MNVDREAFRPMRDPPNPASAVAPCPGVPRWKRALDISFLILAAPLLAPVALTIAGAIKVSSAGPVLFWQERIGIRGERFILLKFRTMGVGADTKIHEAHVARLKEKNQPMTKLDDQGDLRVTRLGGFLRATGLDELPQLFNVLRGQMSLVGPRPSLPSEYESFDPRQQERFCALPGLTGLWQVSGKNRTTFEEMIDLDIRYVRNQSISLDLWILLRTIPVIKAGACAWLARGVRQQPKSSAE